MNFYELKYNLSFPDLGGAITRKADVAALLSLHVEAATCIEGLMRQTGLNCNEDTTGYSVAVWHALDRLLSLHQADIATIRKYMKEHKIEL